MNTQTSDLKERYISNYIIIKTVINKYKVKCLKLIKKLFILSEDSLYK